MSLDPEIAWVLEKAASAKLPPYETLTPAEARKLYARSANVLDVAVEPMEVAEDRLVAGVPARLYAPAETGRPDPLMVYCHGGGWTIGSVATHDRLCRYLATLAGIRVLSVDYRLAPEHPAPAAFEDAWAVWREATHDPAAFGADSTRLIVGGDSAGGSLAALLAQRARDAGGRQPVLQVLFYPSTDLAGDHESIRRFGQGYLLTEPLIRWFLGHYVPDPAKRADPAVSPLRAATLAGLPRTHIQTAGYDPIQDEGEAYARALAEAGVAVEHRHFPGLVHGYAQLAGYAKAAKAALHDAAGAIRRAVHGARH
jgi:acetyl esterase